MRVRVCLLLLLLAGCGGASEATVPTPASGSPANPPNPSPADSGNQGAGGELAITLEEAGAGFADPTFLTHAGDGSGRIFVVEQPGAIRTLDGAPFLDLRDRVNNGANEQGLLGLAFAPDFRTSGTFYVNYTARNDDSITARYRLSADGKTGDPASEEILLRIEDPAPNHNGGMLAFGPDGYLYVGLGDGGAADDAFHNSQNRESLWGKLLRLDVSGAGDQPAGGYAIPADNPFPGDRPEIWAYGLRNPWRFSFDRATGDLYVGDVGQNQFEWVLFQEAGAETRAGRNYGWPLTEGFDCRDSEPCDKSGITPPIVQYSHDLGCTVIGGYVYRGARYPALVGTYFFADYCSGRIWRLERPATGGRGRAVELLDAEMTISSFGEDEAGEIYVVAHNEGKIYHLAASGR